MLDLAVQRGKRGMYLPAGTGSYPISIGYRCFSLLFAVGYAAILAALPVDAFSDRVNYLNYAENSWRIFQRFLEEGFLVTLANEPLWLMLNGALGELFSANIVVRILIFISAFLVSWLSLQHNPGNIIWLVLFLLLPQIIKNHIVHIRQGTAVAVFLMGWFCRRTSVRWLLMGLTPFIHTSFAILLVFLALAGLSGKLKLAPDIRMGIYGLTGIGIGTSLGWIASLVDARQVAYYEFAMADVSGLGFVFWMAVLLLMVLQGWEFLRRYAFEISVIVFYLSTYFLIEVTARVFESGLLLILFAGMCLTGWRRPTFLSLIVLYGVIQYAIYWDQPWLGFGA